MQKSGTNLLMQILDQPPWFTYVAGHTYLEKMNDLIHQIRPAALVSIDDSLSILRNFGNGLMGHLPYDDKFSEALFSVPETKLIQLIRDPRDVAVSHLHSLAMFPDSNINFRYRDGLSLSQKEDPLLWIIRSLPLRWGAFLPWTEKEMSYVIRFEDLIENKQETVSALWVELGGSRNMGCDAAEAIRRIKPATSITFRKGIVGDWRNEFKLRHAQEYGRLMGDIHEEMGYAL